MSVVPRHPLHPLHLSGQSQFPLRPYSASWCHSSIWTSFGHKTAHRRHQNTHKQFHTLLHLHTVNAELVCRLEAERGIWDILGNWPCPNRHSQTGPNGKMPAPTDTYAINTPLVTSETQNAGKLRRALKRTSGSRIFNRMEALILSTNRDLVRSVYSVCYSNIKPFGHYFWMKIPKETNWIFLGAFLYL